MIRSKISKLRNKISSKISSKISTKIGGKISREIGSNVRSKISSNINRKISRKIRSEISRKMSSKISTSNFLLDGVVSNLNLRVVIYSGEYLLCLRFFGFEPEASPGEGLRLCIFIFCLSLFFLLSFGLRSMCGGTCIWLKSSSGLEVLIRSHWSFVQWGMTILLCICC
jgi:hypothetical protein